MYRLTITGLLAIAVCATSSAQTDKRDEALEAMQACQQIHLAEVRLACVDAASKVLNRLESNIAQPVIPAPGASGQDKSITQATADLEADRARLNAERAALEAEKAVIEKKRSELAELENVEQPKPRRFSALSAFTGEARASEAPVTIVKITRNRRNIHKFHTSDGDILTQSEVNQNLYPPSSLPAAATIKRSRFGAKWLSFDERPNRGLKVKLPEGLR